MKSGGQENQKKMRGDIGADQTNKSRKFNTKMHRQKMMRKGEKKQREKKLRIGISLPRF